MYSDSDIEREIILDRIVFIEFVFFLLFFSEFFEFFESGNSEYSFIDFDCDSLLEFIVNLLKFEDLDENKDFYIFEFIDKFDDFVLNLFKL